MDNSKSLVGKKCIITGGTSGIGQKIAEELARLGAEITIISRNYERCVETVKEIVTSTNNHQIDFLVADLTSISEVSKAAEIYIENNSYLDLLINNVGGFFLKKELSVDGIEKTFALNHLAAFQLTNMLVPLLANSISSRVINISSNAHKKQKINLGRIRQGKYPTWYLAYGQSKLANILFTYELDRRIPFSNIAVNAIHPGLVSTGIAYKSHGLTKIVKPILDRMMMPVEEGVAPIVFLATSEEIEGVTGKYFSRYQSVPSSEESYDEQVAKELWELSEDLIGIKFNF